MAELNVKIRVLDLPAFDLFKKAAPAWCEYVTRPEYEASQVEKELVGAIMEIAEFEPLKENAPATPFGSVTDKPPATNTVRAAS